MPSRDRDGPDDPRAPTAPEPAADRRPEVLFQTAYQEQPGRDYSAPPDARGFDGGQHLVSRDGHGRPVMVEGWARREPGAELGDGDRERVCGVVRDGLHTSHLFSRSLGGEREGNLVKLPAEMNTVSSSIEGDLARRVRDDQALYVQGQAIYGPHDLEMPSAVDVKVWTRDDAGQPAFVAGYRVTEDGLQQYH